MMKSKSSSYKEGDLYRVIKVFDIEFPLLYGYYEEKDRENPLVEPMPIYPDLGKDPKYTAEGLRIVTRMQDACEGYDGEWDSDELCGECKHFQRCEALFGVCRRCRQENP